MKVVRNIQTLISRKLTTVKPHIWFLRRKQRLRLYVFSWKLHYSFFCLTIMWVSFYNELKDSNSQEFIIRAKISIFNLPKSLRVFYIGFVSFLHVQWHCVINCRNVSEKAESWHKATYPVLYSSTAGRKSNDKEHNIRYFCTRGVLISNHSLITTSYLVQSSTAFSVLRCPIPCY